jgi:chromatin remodeling complex protein RSC6
MLIFVSGHHPILGTQMLYFLDSVLNARAALPPPTKFFTLEDHKPVPQHALNRTRNVVSKPEVVTTAEFVPDVEQRLIEQSHVEQGGK